MTPKDLDERLSEVIEAYRDRVNKLYGPDTYKTIETAANCQNMAKTLVMLGALELPIPLKMAKEFGSALALIAGVTIHRSNLSLDQANELAQELNELSEKQVRPFIQGGGTPNDF